MRNFKFLPLFLATAIGAFSCVGCSANNSTPSSSQPSSSEQTISVAPSSSDTQTGPATPSTDDNYEEGTSDTDNIVNTTAADKVILVVSFGTSFNQSRDMAIGAIETAIKDAYPDYQVRRAFTSQIIIDKLAKRENLKIDNVTEAMDRLVLDKVKEVVIQPTTVMNGYEYDDMIAEVTPYADKFESIKIGKHLLCDQDDYTKVAKELVNVTSQYRADDTAIVYMGHGTEHESVATYTKLQEELAAQNFNDYIIGTVEHGVELDDVRAMLKEKNVKKVVLRPLMIVAGDHANNDMAGDEDDSWKVVLIKDGYEVVTVLEGLGQIKGIQDIYVDHVKNAVASERISAPKTEPLTDTSPTKIIKDGTYSIDVATDSGMFKVVDCKLTVKNGEMSAQITMSGTGFSKLYLGKADAASTDTANIHEAVVVEEKNTFTLPVSSLDTVLDCAAYGVKSEKWYDHTLEFKSDKIAADESTDTASTNVNVKIVGGTGRVTIVSPTQIISKEGKTFAKVEWSSPNYTYMIVDGVKYLPINSEGNSTFEIPVVIDKDMKVIACTVAMSSPKEIEYTLNFSKV